MPYLVLGLGSRGAGGSVVQCLAHDLKVVSSFLGHGSFLARGAALSLILAELYDLELPSLGDYFITFEC